MKITQNFTWQEFCSHDGADVPHDLRPNTERLCRDVLEPIRAQWVGPLIVISGYRSPEYNRRVGGAARSRHVEGDAADIRPVNMARVGELAALVEEMIGAGDLPGLGGFGRYKNWVHVDARPTTNGHIARWTGRGVGSES